MNTSMTLWLLTWQKQKNIREIKKLIENKTKSIIMSLNKVTMRPITYKTQIDKQQNFLCQKDVKTRNYKGNVDDKRYR